MSLAKVLPLLAALAVPVLAETKADPAEAIRKNDQILLALAKVRPLPKANKDSMRVIIGHMFSFEEMGKRSLGKAWDGLSKADRDTFLVLFTRAVQNISVQRLEKYSADSTHYAAKGAGEKTVVNTIIYDGGIPAKVDYKMFQEKGQWKAWDLVTDAGSTLATYRDQFKTLIASKGFPAVLAKLRAKAGN